MITVLVVDDSPVDRRLAASLLEKQLGVQVAYAEDGQAAVAAIRQAPPDIVLTDMQMPNMNGLQLVEHIRKHHPLVPVILMTAHGSEEIAGEALRKGAASYVPKRNLAQDLAHTVENLLAVTRADRNHRRALECVTRAETEFILGNDPELIAPLVGYLEAGLTRMKLCDETGLIRVAVALREALVNAMEHGNLEASSALREHGQGEPYRDLLKARRSQEPYFNRRVHVSANESPAEAIYTVRDEGPGFDPSNLPDPTDPANLEKVHGRGILLIRTFMDEVQHHSNGREITMTKRRDATASV